MAEKAITSMQDVYNEFAATYDKNRGSFDMSGIIHGFFQRLDLERGHLLDLGCGAGEPFVRFFIDRGWTVTGVDFSARMLELANKYVPEMVPVHGDMRDVEFSASQFDAITAIYSLFHVPHSEHASLFTRFYQWLKPGGRALFTYASKEYTGSEQFDGYINFLGKDLYYSHLTPKRLYLDLENTGFEIEAGDYRSIGDEIFLWVTVRKPG
jgi:cyclopropane fatty-acyl-phospholipid synthase-like methyltransferase